MSEPQFGLREMAETAHRAERERDAALEQLAAERTRREALETFVQGFADMAENAVAHHTKPKTGMQVPYHDDFANLPPSGVSALERWWKAAVAALKPETK